MVKLKREVGAEPPLIKGGLGSNTPSLGYMQVFTDHP